VLFDYGHRFGELRHSGYSSRQGHGRQHSHRASAHLSRDRSLSPGARLAKYCTPLRIFENFASAGAELLSTAVVLPDRPSNPACAANAEQSGDPRKRRRCSAWRCGAVYAEWCRSLGALPSQCGTVVGIDSRRMRGLQGKPAETRAPPWITVCPFQLIDGDTIM
jgi:hypothetical protein